MIICKKPALLDDHLQEASPCRISTTTTTTTWVTGGRVVTRVTAVTRSDRTERGEEGKGERGEKIFADGQTGTPIEGNTICPRKPKNSFIIGSKNSAVSEFRS